MPIITSDELKDMLGLGGTVLTANEQAALSFVHAGSEAKVIDHLGYDPKQLSRTQFYPRRDLHGLSGRGSFIDVNKSHTQAIIVNASVTQHLQLENIPVRSITSLHVDRGGRFGTASGAFPSGTVWTEGEDFYPEYDEATLCRSGILIAAGGWPVTPGSVQVVYVGGYSTAEFNGLSTVDASGVKRAVMLTAIKAFSTWMQHQKKQYAGWTAGPLKSERLGDYNYTLGNSDNFAGMAISLPAEAVDELSQYVHYGIQVL